VWHGKRRLGRLLLGRLPLEWFLPLELQVAAELVSEGVARHEAGKPAA
jgi:hypothetical protein